MKTQNAVQIVRQQNELDLINLEEPKTLEVNAEMRPLLNIINENGRPNFQNLKDSFYLI